MSSASLTLGDQLLKNEEVVRFSPHKKGGYFSDPRARHTEQNNTTAKTPQQNKQLIIST